jgi:hypothetical protein
MIDPFASPLTYFPKPEEPSYPQTQYEAKSIDVSDYGRLQEELGIPAGRTLVAIKVLFPWPHYVFDLIGSHVTPDDPRQAPRYWLHGSPPHQNQPRRAAPHRVFDPISSSQDILIAWRRRVAYQKASAWLEARWHPDRGETVMVHREASTRPFMEAHDADRALYRGYALLHQNGRPQGSGSYATREAFLNDACPIIQKLRQEGKRPTRENVAELYPRKTSARQLYEWGKSFGMAWKDVCNACSIL